VDTIPFSIGANKTSRAGAELPFPILYLARLLTKLSWRFKKSDVEAAVAANRERNIFKIDKNEAKSKNVRA